MTAPTFPRSPHDTLHGMAYFPRMLDKIRLFGKGLLPVVYQKHLGVDYDGRCLRFLGVTYAEIRILVAQGKSDEEILAWCYTHGGRPTVEEIDVWSTFMRKRGWRDDASGNVIFRLKEANLEHRAGDALTMFDFIDIDEGRTPPVYADA